MSLPIFHIFIVKMLQPSSNTQNMCTFDDAFDCACFNNDFVWLVEILPVMLLGSYNMIGLYLSQVLFCFFKSTIWLLAFGMVIGNYLKALLKVNAVSSSSLPYGFQRQSAKNSDF